MVTAAAIRTRPAKAAEPALALVSHRTALSAPRKPLAILHLKIRSKLLLLRKSGAVNRRIVRGATVSASSGWSCLASKRLARAVHRGPDETGQLGWPIRARQCNNSRRNPGIAAGANKACHRGNDHAGHALLQPGAGSFAAIALGVQVHESWRSGRESNPHSRICSPLHHHSATGPRGRARYIVRRALFGQARPRRSGRNLNGVRPRRSGRPRLRCRNVLTAEY